MEKGRLIGQGRTAEIFEWGEGKILKLFRKNFPKVAVENEYTVSKKLYSIGIPIAEVFDLIEYENRQGIIYELIDGISMMKIISIRPWSINKEARRMAELHKAIQKKVDFEFPDKKDRLKAGITVTDMLTDSIKSKLYAYIDKLPGDSILCHGDFHPDNILISKEKAVVIDWMDAAKGNPLADIARTSIIFKYAAVPQEKSFFEKKVINFVRNKFYSEYMKHYLKISGVDIKQVQKWELPVAAARLREWLPDREKEALMDFVNEEIDKIDLEDME